jgi:sulfite reductase alpha subunit-like flavoprotein
MYPVSRTALRKALKSSPNESTNDLWKATSNHTNIQYDAYNSTKEVLKDFRSGHEDKLLNQLTSRGSFFCNGTKFALPQLNKAWSIAQSKLPKNIYNFTIRYINNSLPTRKI